MTDDGARFEPGHHLRRLRGQGGGMYLDAKWRLAWIDDLTKAAKERADGYTIETEMVEHDPGQGAVFRAVVTLMEGGTVLRRCSGFGSETRSDFGDYLEKAEKKAISRALDHCGFGSVAAMEDDERISDAGVQAEALPHPRQAPPRRPTERRAPPQHQSAGGAATQRQIGFLSQLIAEMGLPEDEWRAQMRGVTGKASRTELTGQDASRFIDHLQQRRRQSANADRPVRRLGGPPPYDDAPPVDEIPF